MKDDRREFGFVAKRCAKGTLISGRASNKSAPNQDDIALLSNCDSEDLKLDVVSTKAKAAASAALADLALKARPDINYVIQTPLQFTGAPMTDIERSAGTLEELEAVDELVSQGHGVIGLKNRGTLLLLKDLDALPAVLEKFSDAEQSSEIESLLDRKQREDSLASELASNEPLNETFTSDIGKLSPLELEQVLTEKRAELKDGDALGITLLNSSPSISAALERAENDKYVLMRQTGVSIVGDSLFRTESSQIFGKNEATMLRNLKTDRFHLYTTEVVEAIAKKAGYALDSVVLRDELQAFVLRAV